MWSYCSKIPTLMRGGRERKKWREGRRARGREDGREGEGRKEGERKNGGGGKGGSSNTEKTAGFPCIHPENTALLCSLPSLPAATGVTQNQPETYSHTLTQSCSDR